MDNYLSDMSVRPNILGGSVLLSPFSEHDSSQRLNMHYQHAAQSVVVDGAEVPLIETGWENMVGQYEFTTEERDLDGQVLKVIPKYTLTSGAYSIQRNPSYTVVYVDSKEQLDCFEIKEYTQLNGGFGFINKVADEFVPREGAFLSRDTKFRTSPNHTQMGYANGVNANVVYIPHYGTVEDAFVISDRLRDKLTHTEINSVSITMSADSIPLNLYGDDDVYKIFPDIGSFVREDGKLIGLRDKTEQSLLTDFTPMALRETMPLCDSVYVVPAGAEILDVEIFISSDAIRNIQGRKIYDQLRFYQDQRYQYYSEISRLYETYRATYDYKCTPAFSNEVVRAKILNPRDEGSRVKLMDKKESVDFIKLVITYGVKQSIDVGYKLSDRHGAKGVVSTVLPLEDMPVDDYGNHADLIISAESPFNRLNVGQWIEQFINFMSTVVVERMRQMDSQGATTETLYAYLMDYLKSVRENWATVVAEGTQTPKEQELLVKEVLNTGKIYFSIPPYCKELRQEKCAALIKKYNLEASPVTYHDPNTGSVFRTSYPALIGSKYIYLLGKIPKDQMMSVEWGYKSQFNLPVKPKSKKLKAQCPFGQTPVRYGENEIAILCMSVGPEVTCRLMGLYANSQPAIEALQDALLAAEHPTAIPQINMTTADIIKSSVAMDMFVHQLAVCGIKLDGEIINASTMGVQGL